MRALTENRFATAAFMMVALLLSPRSVSAGETIVDTNRGFSLTLPDGFVQTPGLAADNEDIIYAFALADANGDDLDVMLFVEKMAGTIGRGHVKSKDLPPGFKGRVFTTSWQGFEVDAFEVPEQLGEVPVSTYNVQIPLKRAAIQVKLFGPDTRASELKRLLPKILGGLHGESNWTPSVSPLAFSENYGRFLLAFAIVFVLGGLIALFLVSKKAPKGAVLIIAAGIYVASWAIGGTRVREVMVLSGSMRMLGFAGGILGIVDVFRKRKPLPKSMNAFPTDDPLNAIVIESSGGDTSKQ